MEDHKDKEMTRAEAIKKIDAWKTLNSVLVKANTEFMQSLNNILVEKQVQHEELKNKLEKGEGTEEENATLLYLTGYVDALKEILKKKA